MKADTSRFQQVKVFKIKSDCNNFHTTQVHNYGCGL